MSVVFQQSEREWAKVGQQRGDTWKEGHGGRVGSRVIDHEVHKCRSHDDMSVTCDGERRR